jgi:serine/threonine protein kinase
MDINLTKNSANQGGVTAPANEKNRLPDSKDGRWTEIELLPDWDEEYYDVYTAKKHGKWVMLKTLKAKYRDDEQYLAMFEKEFDARYNISHANIVMINDFEDVEGIGRCIITDDVYGDSLRKLVDEGRLTDRHFEQLKFRLPAAMEYIQLNHLAHHPIGLDTILFTENVGNLKLIDVGFDQRRSLSHADTDDDIINYGLIINEVLAKTGRRDPQMKKIADRCLDPRRRYKDVQALEMAISGKSPNKLYLMIILFLAAMVAVLAWLLSNKPDPTV